MDEIASRVIEALRRQGTVFEIVECDPELADTAAFCKHYGYALNESANTILVASRRPEGRYAACVVLASDRLDVNGIVRRRLGVRKASFADAETTVSLTGMLVGGVTPFALPADVPVWVDASVVELDWVIVGGGSRSVKLRVGPDAFASAGAEIVEGLAKPRTA
jgi:prolyl-tRNA editing enzyme YbaK/EbsC (Cys-tRNA(Pro) deacylase)